MAHPLNPLASALVPIDAVRASPSARVSASGTGTHGKSLPDECLESRVEFIEISSALHPAFTDRRDSAGMKLPVPGPTLRQLNAMLMVPFLTLSSSPASETVTADPVAIAGLIAEMPFRLDLPALFMIGYVLAWLLATTHAFRPGVKFVRAWRVFAVVLSIGLSMLLGARFIGGSLDAQGVLHEPFFLVAIGSLVCLAGLGMAILLGLFNLVSKIVAHHSRR
ncbi:MAG: DUF3955 domain-containing protein [Verrucomicrobiales bacterium]|nr:DUF3955 domain-containing protein [Verrucomicrobiales bacterium]